VKTEETASAAMARLLEKQIERADLLTQLERSLALESIWPEIFQLDTRPRMQVTGHPDRQLTATIRAANQSRQLRLEQLPVMLWPKDVIDHIRKRGHAARHVYAGIIALIDRGEIETVKRLVPETDRVIRSKMRARQLIRRGEDLQQIDTPRGTRYWLWRAPAAPETTLTEEK
jgi:hypothetical protein